MLVMNRAEDEQDIPPRLGGIIATALQAHPKSVWLCSSRSDAEKFQTAVLAWLEKVGRKDDETWLLRPMGDEIDRFKAAARGHLFVAGRFDGMDFKADECRLVILTTMPRAINLQEQFFSAYLRDAGFMLRRLNQRIVQALGRCNRDPEDYAVYVLADRRFPHHFGRESNRVGVPPNMMSEIDAAEDGTTLTEEQLRSAVGNFLTGKFRDFDQMMTSYAGSVPQAGAAVVIRSDEEVQGWLELMNQNYASSSEHFANAAKEAGTAGARELAAFMLWCQAKASFLLGKQGERKAREEALTLLQQAIDTGGKSSWFNRLRTSLNRHKSAKEPTYAVGRLDYATALIHSFDEHMERVGSGGRFQKWAEALKTKLHSEAHSEYQEGLEKLGVLLGFYALRPKHSAGTDCYWRGVFGNSREFVTFEAKIEHGSSTKVSPKDIGQAHTQLARAREQFGRAGFVVRSAIVTHMTELEDAARSSVGELSVISKDSVIALADKTLNLLSLYRDKWSSDDVQVRLNAADELTGRVPTSGWLIRALEPGVRLEDCNRLIAEWN